MVRHYKRKKEKTYSELQIQKALDDVRKKKMTTYAAAAYYQIPRSTLNTRLTCIRDSPGRPTVFTPKFEKCMAENLHIMERYGFPLTRKEASILISEYVRRNGIHTPFKDDIPGKDWFHALQRRNELSIKKPQAVEISRRKACDPFIVYEYFDILERVVDELDLKEKPHRIYNLDETSMCDDPVKGKVIGKKGFRSTRTTSGPGRSNTTVLLATNACGGKLPPLIIFQGKHLWEHWLFPDENVPTAYAVSKKGWMETSIFEKYMREVFVPSTRGERPLLLIFDGHSTHVDLSVIEYAASEGITIVKLPAHSSDVLQPLDCSTMKPLKDKWEDEVIKWQRLNIGTKLPKPQFARILTKVWSEINPVIIQNGFRRTGAYPVDRNAIPKQLFDSLKWQKWEAFQTQKDLTSTQERSESVTNATICIVPSLKLLTLEKINNIHMDENQGLKTGIRCFNTETNSQAMKDESTSRQNRFVNENKTIEPQDNGSILTVKKESFVKTYKKGNKLNQSINLNEHHDQYDAEPTNDIKTTTAIETNTNASSTNNTIKLTIPKRMLGAQTESRLNILEVKTIKPPTKIYEHVTFESLLLNTIAKGDRVQTCRKRVPNSSAEVMTYKSVLERIKQEKEDKENKSKSKYKRKVNANIDQTKIKQKRPKLQIECSNKKENKLTKGKKQGKKGKGSKRHIKEDDSDSNSSGSYNSDSESADEENAETFFNNILKAQEENDDSMLIKNTTTLEETQSFEGQKNKKRTIKNTSGNRRPVSEATVKHHKEKEPIAGTSKDDTTQEQAGCPSVFKPHKEKESVADTSKYETKKKRAGCPRKGNFILAKFSSTKGKRTYKYVCIVDDVVEKKIVVLGLKSKDKTKTIFRIVKNDYSIIDNEDIIDYLPTPKQMANNDFVFPCKIEVSELLIGFETVITINATLCTDLLICLLILHLFDIF
ncbi:hypothetical protein O0L34_g19317 [Tuta absoluta]|nr:hypothetical protein O0L34_g19317 [Tuta absoluta]